MRPDESRAVLPGKKVVNDMIEFIKFVIIVLVIIGLFIGFIVSMIYASTPICEQEWEERVVVINAWVESTAFASSPYFRTNSTSYTGRIQSDVLLIIGEKVTLILDHCHYPREQTRVSLIDWRLGW